MSTSSVSCYVSPDEFKLFHRIDRELYTLLVINLWRDPVESMRIMAFWLWLEQVGFRNVVKNMLSLPCALISELAEETFACLKRISNDQIPPSPYENSEISLMQGFLGRDISLQFFHENRIAATQNVSKILKEVCARALNDIAQKALDRNAKHNLSMMSNNIPVQQPQPEFHAVENITVAPESRTMFVTFPKGYPIYEAEVKEFFNRAYGDCIESLHMQEEQPNEQSLFARIVFRSASTIEVILNGMDKVKFTINGKHVWARKFIPRCTEATMAQGPPPPRFLAI